jgi:hypothetical protein
MGSNTHTPLQRKRINIISRARIAYKRYGLYFIIRRGLITAPDYFWAWYYKKFNSSETFEFQGNTYHYLFHEYHTTWKNERAVVIPIVWDIVKRYQEQRKRILEVGNVLSYYFQVNHDILDKYEIIDGVINEDVVDFNPPKQYDLIVTIFTLLDVGFDENIFTMAKPSLFFGLDKTPRDPMKFMRAIENLNRLLAEDGQMVIIHSLGYNHEMDKSLENGTLQLHEQHYLKRMSNHK